MNGGRTVPILTPNAETMEKEKDQDGRRQTDNGEEKERNQDGRRPTDNGWNKGKGKGKGGSQQKRYQPNRWYRKRGMRH